MTLQKAFVLAVLAVVLAVVLAHVHFYPVGVFVDLPLGHWVGLELSPTPGLFVDVS